MPDTYPTDPAAGSEYTDPSAASPEYAGDASMGGDLSTSGF